MKAILSTTYDDTYLFYLPLTAWTWNKLGIDCVCFIPGPSSRYFSGKYELVFNTLHKQRIRCNNFLINSPEDKEGTYAQCSRLFAACIEGIDDNEVLITGDIDMAVFNKDFFDSLSDEQLHVVGTDLVPIGQFPMCYLAMPAKTWREVMWISKRNTMQDKLDELLGHLECDHFRGNYWAKDQETAYNHIVASGLPIVKHNRAKPGTQFATRRADRDGWPEVIPPDINDAHLPRPGYQEENFAKILNLFQTMYPKDDFTWMAEYRNEYIKLL